MNAAKSFINFCWEPFMKEICMYLGFVSENAQIYAKKGSDHHKLWDLLEIVYIALTDELLFDFVSETTWNHQLIIIGALSAKK